MITKPPRYKATKPIQAPYLKNVKGESETTIFMKPKHMKVNSSICRQFGKDITNIENNSTSFIPQRNSFCTKEQPKIKVFIEKHMSVNDIQHDMNPAKTNRNVHNSNSFVFKKPNINNSLDKKITSMTSGLGSTKSKTLRGSNSNIGTELRNSVAVVNKATYRNSFNQNSKNSCTSINRNVSKEIKSISGTRQQTQENTECFKQEKQWTSQISHFNAIDKENISPNNGFNSQSSINDKKNEMWINRMNNQKLGLNVWKNQYIQSKNSSKLKANIKSISIPNPISPRNEVSYTQQYKARPLTTKPISSKTESHFTKTTEQRTIEYFPHNIQKYPNIQIPYEYLNEIYHNLLLEECQGIIPSINLNYMINQNEINEKMRSILIDWIIDVHLKFNFTDETLFMTVSIIDRYWSIEKVSRSNLQLLGITAMWITCKHEEIDVPKVEDFIYITDNAYKREDVFAMEYDILHKLNFSLLHPSPIKFFELLAIGFEFNRTKIMMGKYWIESFLIEIKNIKYHSSIIACASAYIVMKFFKMKNYAESYDKKYYYISSNTTNSADIRSSVKECAKDICWFVDNIQKSGYTAIVKKYSKDEYEKVAILITSTK